MALEGGMDREKSVDRFWDQIVQGRDGEIDGGDLPLPDVATIRRFHAADDRPEPSPAFARRLWEDLSRASAIPTVPDPSRRAGANGHMGPVTLVPLVTPTSSTGPRSWATSLATAALVLLTLLGSYVAFGGPLRQRWEERSAFIPAVATSQQSPAETPPTHGEFQGVVQDVLPGSTRTGIARDYLQPGAKVALFSDKSGGIAISSTFLIVETGRLELTAGGAIDVLRAGGGKVTTPVAAGTTVTLEAGDGAVVVPGVAIDLRNPGPDLATAINAGVVPVGPGAAAAGYRIDTLAELYDAPIRAPATMRLRQTTIAAGETLPPPPQGVVQLAAADTNMGFMLHTNDAMRREASAAASRVRAPP
jgi:hypothetical protein